MAVFISLMAALAVLFSGAVETVRGSYQLLDAYEVGRTAVDVIDQDLKGAFTAREYGDVYNFYGTPYGFMFVGALEDGQLGRVTYALHPDAETVDYEMNALFTWKELREAASEQAVDVVRRYGLPVKGDALTAFVAAWQVVVAQKLGQVGLTLPTALPDDFIFEVDAIATTWSIVRYEEPGVSDLDTFQLMARRNGAGLVQWPPLRPRDYKADYDDLNALDGNELYNPEYNLLGAMLTAVNNDPSLLPDNDLRSLALAGTVQNYDQPYRLRGITHDTASEILASARRALWLRLLQGEEVIPGHLFWATDEALADAQYRYESTGDGSDLEYLESRPNANDYVVAEGVLRSLIMRSPDTGDIVYVTPQDIAAFLGATLDFEPQRAQAFAAAGLFAYGDGNEHYLPYYNTAENIRSNQGLYVASAGGESQPFFYTYNDWLAGNVAISGDYPTPALDKTIIDASTRGRRAEAVLGSPLLPRLPAVVVVNIEISEEHVSPGAGDFRRKFTQAVDVPTAIGAGTGPPNFIASPAT